MSHSFNQKQYAINPNLQSQINQYFEKAFLNYSKVLLVRFDLHYKEDVIVDEHHSLHSLTIKAYQDVAMLMHHLKHNKRTKNIIGGISAFELSRNNRLHIHVTLLVNGQLHQRYHTFFEEAKHFWMKRISRSSFVYDCHRENGNNYKVNLLQNINHNNQALRAQLPKLVDYFSKQESKEQMNDFYQLQLSSIKPKDNRGRKRKLE